jgi:hypothetical protein
LRKKVAKNYHFSTFLVILASLVEACGEQGGKNLGAARNLLYFMLHAAVMIMGYSISLPDFALKSVS